MEHVEEDKSHGAIRRFSRLSVRIQLFPAFFKGRQMWVGGNKTNYREVADIRPLRSRCPGVIVP